MSAPLRLGSPAHQALRHLLGGAGLAAFRLAGEGRVTGLSLTPAGDAELARLRGPAP